LTVLKALEHALPEESFIYFGDTAHVPYGSKSDATVQNYARQITEFLIDQEVKMIVVACNTASSVALEMLQDTFRLPIFGVVEPAVRKAAEISKTGEIGVIGTRATISSEAYPKRFLEFFPGVKVHSQACPLFVSLVEEGWESTHVAEEIAVEYLKIFNDTKLDTLILGCTHYPVLLNTIRKVMPEDVKLITSGDAIADELKKYLKLNKLENTSIKRSVSYYVTDMPQQFDVLGSRFLGRSLANVQYLNSF